MTAVLLASMALILALAAAVYLVRIYLDGAR